MDEFLIFYAPFLIVIISIVLAFWASLKDDLIKK